MRKKGKAVSFLRRASIGKVPKEWGIVRLAEVISLCQSGIWGDDPSPNQEAYPIVRSTEITHDGKIDVSTVAFRKIPEEKIGKYNLQNGDIVLVASSGSSHLIGRAARFEQPGDTNLYLFSNFVIRIRPQNIDSNFLYYSLSSPRYHHFLECLQQTSTGLRNLPKMEFVQFRLPLPPFPEQQKIAEILSAVDNAIEKVDDATAKTQRLKRGLMQELLTKGIGHKEFKDTEIGRIPREWGVVRLGTYVDVYSGYAFKRQTFLPKGRNGIPVIKIGNLQGGSIVIDENTAYVSGDFSDKLPEFQLRCGDVLVALSGATTGKIAVVDRNIGLLLVNQRVGKFRILNSEKIKQGFFYYLTQSCTFRRFVLRNIGQSAQGNLSPNQIKTARIVLPSPSEQRRIAEILGEVDSRLELLRVRKEKLERTKKGLMNDLLTGKRRVGRV